MFSLKIKMLATLVVALASVPSAFSQQPQNPGQPAPAAPDYVTEKGFRSRVFEIKHRNPDTLLSVLRPLGSGFKGATLTASGNFKTLTMRDFPENIAAVEEALKRLDTPEASNPDIELRIHVLLASNAEDGANQLPAELKDVVKQLQSTLSYKSYLLLTTALQRVRENTANADGFQGNGTAQIRVPEGTASKDLDASYSYRLLSILLTPNNQGATQVQLNGFRFNIEGGLGRAYVQTDVTVRDGEKVVVGTSSLRDKGLILVLSAKVVK